MEKSVPKTTNQAKEPIFYSRTNSNNPGTVKLYPGIIPAPEVRTRKTLLKFEQIDLCRQQGNCAGWENGFRLGVLR